MILQRIAASLRKHAWRTVLLEILIVVVGIVIGLQADDWNKARSDRALEHEYLQRIYFDLQGTLAQKPENDQWNRDRLAQQSMILHALWSGVLAEEDRQAFQTGLLWFGFVGGVDVQWSTVDELHSSGSMGLIRDVALRSMILQTNEELERRQGISANFNKQIYAYRLKIGDRYGVQDYTQKTREATLNFDFAALAADAGFINALSKIDFLARFKMDIMNGQLADIRRLRDELAQRLDPAGDSASR